MCTVATARLPVQTLHMCWPTQSSCLPQTCTALRYRTYISVQHVCDISRT